MLSLSDVDLILSAFHTDDAVYLPIQIMDKTFHGMLDSGASHVLVNKKGCQKLEALGLSLNKGEMACCSLADDTRIDSIGTITTPVKLKNEYRVIDVLVVPAMWYELVLGREFWRKFAGFKILPGGRSGYGTVVYTWKCSRSTRPGAESSFPP